MGKNQYTGRLTARTPLEARDLYLKNQGVYTVVIRNKEYGNVYLYARKGTAYQDTQLSKINWRREVV